MEISNLANQLLSAGTALAGLILVFLGVVFTAYESYEAPQKSAVRAKYRFRAWLAFAGLACVLCAAAGGMVANWSSWSFWLYAGVTMLSAAFLLLVILALLAIKDMT